MTLKSRSMLSRFIALCCLCVASALLGAAITSAKEPAAAGTPSAVPSATPAAAPAAARVEQSLLLAYLADKTVFTLFDARSPEEFQASHVEGAINLPLDRVAAENPALPDAKSDPIVVYCKTGKRATAVAQALSALGYDNVRVLPSEQLMFHDDLVIFNCTNSGNG